MPQANFCGRVLYCVRSAQVIGSSPEAILWSRGPVISGRADRTLRYGDFNKLTVWCHISDFERCLVICIPTTMTKWYFQGKLGVSYPMSPEKTVTRTRNVASGLFWWNEHPLRGIITMLRYLDKSFRVFSARILRIHFLEPFILCSTLSFANHICSTKPNPKASRSCELFYIKNRAHGRARRTTFAYNWPYRSAERSRNNSRIPQH